MKMIGIIDEYGIENFIPLVGNYKRAFLFFIKSKINIQGNVVFFCLDFTGKEINKINNFVLSREVKSFNEAGIIIAEKINSLNKTSAKTNKLLARFYKLRENL